MLHRLGRIQSRAAIEYSLECFAERPEETEEILGYLKAITCNETDRQRVINFMRSDDAIYDYQLYQFVKWFYEIEVYPVELIELSRVWAMDMNRSPWLRAYSIAVLGRAGTTADLERLENRYAQEGTDVVRAEIIAALAVMESSHRNRFYNRARNDGFLVGRAIGLARETQRQNSQLAR